MSYHHLEGPCFVSDLSLGSRSAAGLMLHGYGADGKNLAGLAPELSPASSGCIWFPNGFFPCEAYPTGRQWFSLKNVHFLSPEGLSVIKKSLDNAAQMLAGYGKIWINLVSEFFSSFDISKTWHGVLNFSENGEVRCSWRFSETPPDFLKEGAPTLTLASMTWNPHSFKTGQGIYGNLCIKWNSKIDIPWLFSDPQTIFWIGGFSQGAAMAYHTALFHYPFSLALNFSGFYDGSEPPVNRPKLFWGHGEEDHVVPIHCMHQALQNLSSYALNVITAIDPSASHHLTPFILKEGQSFIENALFQNRKNP